MPFPHNCYIGGSLENAYWAQEKTVTHEPIVKPAPKPAYQSSVISEPAKETEAISAEDITRLLTAGNGHRKKAAKRLEALHSVVPDPKFKYEKI